MCEGCTNLGPIQLGDCAGGFMSNNVRTDARAGRWRLVAGSVAAAFVLAACGTSTSNTNSKLPSGPVTMGVLSCFTGTLASLGQAMLQGSQVAQKAINDGGGILGQQLKLTHADTQCDEADSVPAVHQLLAASNVVGIIGPETQEINAVAPIVTSAKVPTQFQGGSTLFDKNAVPWLWRDSPSDSQLGVAMALYAYNKGYRKAALVFYSDIAAQTFPPPITNTFTKLGGQVVINITIAPDQTSYRTQVQQVLATQPDVIFTQTDAATAAVLFKNFKDLNNLSIPFVGTDVTGGDDYLKAVTYQVAHDHLISVYGTSVSGAAADEFNKVFAAVVGAGQQPLANANYAYDAVISQALAIDQAKSIVGADINAALGTVSNPPGTQCYTYKTCYDLIKAGTKINYDGASGPLDYNSFHNVFGPYAAFQQDPGTGQQVQVQLLSAADLATATP
jgi:ABC-type branched-subunit amino acid transport system substrate-binding protein